MRSKKIAKKLNDFFVQYELVKFDKGTSVERPGDVPQFVYFIKSGFIRMYAVSPGGEELTLNIFKPGSYSYILLPIEDNSRFYYFEALTEVEAYKAPRGQAVEFIKSDAELLYELLERVGSGVMGLLTRMESLVFGSAYSKVAGVFLILAKRFGMPDGPTRMGIDFPVTHQQVAYMAGLSRETATHQILRLKKDGLVSTDKKCYFVEDMEKLAEVAELSQY